LNAALRNVLGAALLIALAGCVTEETGKGPKVASSETRVQAQLDLARGYIEKREWSRARPALERALEIAPRSSEAHVLMALLNQEEGEKKAAEAEYKTALRYEPTNARALNNYGSFLYSIGRYEDARTELLKATRDLGYSRRAQVYENLGATELKLDHLKEAEEAFQRALSLDSSLARATLEMSEIAFNRGNFVESQQYYDGYLKVSRQSPRSLWLGIRLSRQFNNQDTLASYALLLKNLYPGTEEYRLYQESLQ
jgi:type IV pilus assembly protein PilF